MTKILGLDLGTNSIGWAVVEQKEHHTSLRCSRVKSLFGLLALLWFELSKIIIRIKNFNNHG